MQRVKRSLSNKHLLRLVSPEWLVTFRMVGNPDIERPEFRAKFVTVEAAATEWRGDVEQKSYR